MMLRSDASGTALPTAFWRLIREVAPAWLAGAHHYAARRRPPRSDPATQSDPRQDAIQHPEELRPASRNLHPGPLTEVRFVIATTFLRSRRITPPKQAKCPLCTFARHQVQWPTSGTLPSATPLQEAITMSNSHRMAWITGLCLTIFQATSSVQAQDEVACPGPYEHSHETMLEHAALAELTYEKPQTDPYEIDIFRYCMASTGRQELEGQRIVQNLSIPEYVVNNAKRKLRRQYEENRQSITIVTFQHEGDTLYACERELTLPQRLAIGFKWFQLADKVALGYIFGIVTGLAGTALGGNEEIKIIELRGRTPNGEPIDEELVLGVQGTDPRRLHQWVSSIQRMIADSCTFPFALELMRSFFGSNHDVNLDNSRAVLVGHSLGGAVVQFIGDTTALSGIIENRHDVLNLFGYSFNSFGVPNHQRYGTDHTDVHSVVVAGEVLEQIVTGTSQIGHQYRYDTAASSIEQWVQQLDRHKISTVQRKICGCMDGRDLVYQYTAP